MRKLTIPDALKREFTSVEALWATDAETRRVDALVLSWVKYEKQLRRLFSFFVYQHTDITKDTLDDVIAAFTENRNLYPETFISGLEALGLQPLPELLGPSHATLWLEITRIQIYRNKIMHGQHTGQGIKSAQIELDVAHIIRWVSEVAHAAESAYGYDGLKPNTYSAAKSCKTVHVKSFPFSTPEELSKWLSKLKK